MPVGGATTGVAVDEESDSEYATLAAAVDCDLVWAYMTLEQLG